MYIRQSVHRTIIGRLLCAPRRSIVEGHSTSTRLMSGCSCRRTIATPKYGSTIYQVSVDYKRTVIQLLLYHWLTIDRFIDRLLTDESIDYRQIYRPIYQKKIPDGLPYLLK